jgi:hypothetical protein
MKKANTLLYVAFGTIFGLSQAQAQVSHAPNATVESEISVSQQYVDSITNSLGNHSKINFAASADLQIVGPEIQATTQKALTDFRAFMGVLGISSGLSAAIKDYNNLVKAGKTDELASQKSVIDQQVATAQTLYQAAIADLYRLQPDLLPAKMEVVPVVDDGKHHKRDYVAPPPNEVTVTFLDQSQQTYPASSDVIEDVNYFSTSSQYYYSWGGDRPSAKWLADIIRQRYQTYLYKVCRSKFCVMNVVSEWARYYSHLDKLINRNLNVALADQTVVSIESLDDGAFATVAWEVLYYNLIATMDQFYFDEDHYQALPNYVQN